PTGLHHTYTPNTTSSDTATLPPQPDLSFAKTAANASLVPLSLHDALPILTNNGPSTVSSLKLSDTIPTGLLGYSFGLPSAGSYSTGAQACTVDLPSRASGTLTLSDTIDPSATGSVTNTVSVSPPSGVTDTY